MQSFFILSSLPEFKTLLTSIRKSGLTSNLLSFLISASVHREVYLYYIESEQQQPPAQKEICSRITRQFFFFFYLALVTFVFQNSNDFVLLRQPFDKYFY